MASAQPEGTALVDVLSGQSYTVGAGGGVAITLPPLTAAILVPQSQVVPGL
jgi:alpha-amylase